MRIPSLLFRIRKLISNDQRYDEILDAIGNGSLRAPATPMTDEELGAAIAEFLDARPSQNATDRLGLRFERK